MGDFIVQLSILDPLYTLFGWLTRVLYDFFGNYEGLLPKAKGRTWKECDIDTLGKRARGPKRIIFSNDGLIYYTDDHYESYTQLY